MVTVDEVLAFWLEECSPADWYRADPDFDKMIRDRFEDAWRASYDGSLGLWLASAKGTLAYIILTDQFPRNMFRGSGEAFATDACALAAAKMAIEHRWDMKIDEPARQFFYLPLMHSENLCDQERAVRLIHSRMPLTGAKIGPHTQAHRNVIRDFGRFPYRNEALGRHTTQAEQVFLDAGGYGAAIRAVQQDAK
ncbi:DUF924 family protein [Yoonia sediminilitoris]|uniref:Uncharacterized protein (DUF924 family) n=1 Tax=Yoonia sediminilitoris TaxID=1286148 RepID=A0A2T6KRE6_9RHOB|nr:DUF924 family protein [Yoonia sediminilitoris]PUB19132.1 uncharacterized protein (DUF924 family) [Yoonia sediminilitoris]RCW99300.1 uncharacterized protein (DUF924 family) [Yoonia sediminilitoris]